MNKFNQLGQFINSSLGMSHNKKQNDYDYLGWAKEGLSQNNGQQKTDGYHFPDTYKLPNHATFSNDSQYAIGNNSKMAGQWYDGAQNAYLNSAQYLPSFDGFMAGKMPQHEVWYEQPNLDYQLQLQQLLGRY